MNLLVCIKSTELLSSMVTSFKHPRPSHRQIVKEKEAHVHASEMHWFYFLCNCWHQIDCTAMCSVFTPLSIKLSLMMYSYVESLNILNFNITPPPPPFSIKYECGYTSCRAYNILKSGSHAKFL